jgi:hypothetical protein
MTGRKSASNPILHGRLTQARASGPDCAVRIDDDLAFGGLSEDLGQTHDWHGTGRNNIRQHLPGPD